MADDFGRAGGGAAGDGEAGRWALVLLLILPVRYIVPSLIAGLYVRPNELALEGPYIQHHIDATRSAYGLNQRVKETSLEAAPEIPIDYAKHKPLLDNVRLWDWRAFHDTISQIQPLRPYVYIDTDVDRYTIDGQLRQVLISPRELDIRQLGEARSRWINPHFIYTHGYGMVMAEANRITPDGLPVLFIKDAPPVCDDEELEVHAAGDLLRRGGARAGVCRHGAAGIQLSVGIGERLHAVQRHGRISRLHRLCCGWRRRFNMAI